MYGRSVSAASVIFVPLAALLCGCSSPTSPGPVGDIAISLRVSGGIAFRDYSYRIDGSRGEIVGEECLNFCDWEPGQTLATVSKADVLALAQQFITDGFLDVDPEDYGEECCDQLHYVLRYQDASSDKTVRGSGGALPAIVNDLAIRVTRFVDESRS